MINSVSDIRGGCLCSSVTYEITGPIHTIENCHCQMCRKAHGAAFSTNGVVAGADFKIKTGAECITAYASSPRRLKCFCSRCGSPLFIRRQNETGSDDASVVVTLGTLNQYTGSGATRHVFVDSKAEWHHIADDLPQYRIYPGYEPA